MEDSALSELLATLKTATGDGLDYIGGLFGARRNATLEVDFASSGHNPNSAIGTWRDVESDEDYRKRIVAVVKEAAVRGVVQDNARINASARLHRVVERAMVSLYARCDLIPATAAGYEMIRNEIACALGDLRAGAVNIEPQPSGFHVTWNGVDCTWLGMTAPRHHDATQWAAAADAWSASNERVALYNEPDRPDGFSQAQVDAAKAVLLAPVAKRVRS